MGGSGSYQQGKSISIRTTFSQKGFPDVRCGTVEANVSSSDRRLDAKVGGFVGLHLGDISPLPTG